MGVNTSLASGEKGGDVASKATFDHYDRCLGWVREAAGDRFDSLELQIAAFAVMVVGSRRAAARTATMLGFPGEEALDLPVVLIGTEDELCERLLERRETVGLQQHRGAGRGDGDLRSRRGPAGRHLSPTPINRPDQPISAASTSRARSSWALVTCSSGDGPAAGRRDRSWPPGPRAPRRRPRRSSPPWPGARRRSLPPARPGGDGPRTAARRRPRRSTTQLSPSSSLNDPPSSWRR